MKVFILRHADAEDTSPDHTRKLSAKGRRQMLNLSNFMQQKEIAEVGEVWHSPLVRAKETAKLIKEGLGLEAPLIEVDHLSPGSHHHITGNALATVEHDVIVVGHNPHFSGLASYLLSGPEESLHILFKKAGMLCLERALPPNNHYPAGIWTLNWYIVPKLLKN